MTELKLNKHLGGERPRDGPGGWASGSSGPGSCSPGSPLAAPAGPRSRHQGVSGHPNIHNPPKNGRQGASLGLLKGLTPFSSGKIFFSVFFGQNLTLPSILGDSRKKRTSAQLSSLNLLKLRVSANKQSCRPPEGHSWPRRTPPAAPLHPPSAVDAGSPAAEFRLLPLGEVLCRLRTRCAAHLARRAHGRGERRVGPRF